MTDPKTIQNTGEDFEPESGHDEQDDAVIGWALRRSLAALVVLGVCGGALAWWLNRPEPQPPTKKTELDVPARTRIPVELPAIPFVDVTGEAGIDFVHQNGAYGDKLLPETMGGGCAFFDYDNDGDQDILFVNSNRWPWAPESDSRSAQPATMGLFQNDGSGTFENVTEGSGLDVSFYGMGSACGDYDNDGDVDVFLSAVGSNRLFRNDQGHFVDVTETAGVAGDPNRWSTSCGWFDMENDGDLDLFVCNYVEWSKQIDLGQDFTLDGKRRAYGRPQEFQGTYSYLFRNDGDGRFRDVSAESDIQIRNPNQDAPAGKSLGVAFADLNSDGLLEIVVSNDTVQNFLFMNRGNGRFEEAGAVTGVAFDVDGNARGAMGIDVARFRNTDSLGIAIGNFSNESTALYVAAGAGPDVLPQFTDEAVSNGISRVTRKELTFGVFFFDADLDSRLDLFAANGHLEEEINLVQPSQYYEQPPQLLWNCGPEHPIEYAELDASQCGADFCRRMVGRGAAYADVDGDGDLDLLITATGAAPRLLRNDQQQGHHWLRLKLVGKTCNRDAIGAWVEVQLAGRTLRQQVMPTRSYLSQVELPVTIGLGDADRVERVTVRWPDGSQQLVPDVTVDRLHVVEQTSEAVP